MKRILRQFIIEVFALYLVTRMTTGLIFENGIVTLILTGAALAASAFLIRPIVNLLILPINLVTFGFFKWLSSAITLYLITLVVPGFKITNFLLHEYPNAYFTIPSIAFAGIMALIAFSFMLSIITSFIHWLFK